MSDKRPYRVETWRQGELVLATVIFSTDLLEEQSAGQLVERIVEEGIVRFRHIGHRYVEAGRLLDGANLPMWAINIVLEDGAHRYAYVLPRVSEYRPHHAEPVWTTASVL